MPSNLTHSTLSNNSNRASPSPISNRVSHSSNQTGIFPRITVLQNTGLIARPAVVFTPATPPRRQGSPIKEIPFKVHAPPALSVQLLITSTTAHIHRWPRCSCNHLRTTPQDDNARNTLQHYRLWFHAAFGIGAGPPGSTGSAGAAARLDPRPCILVTSTGFGTARMASLRTSSLTSHHERAMNARVLPSGALIASLCKSRWISTPCWRAGEWRKWVRGLGTAGGA
jgi:hypothetical protein